MGGRGHPAAPCFRFACPPGPGVPSPSGPFAGMAQEPGEVAVFCVHALPGVVGPGARPGQGHSVLVPAPTPGLPGSRSPGCKAPESCGAAPVLGQHVHLCGR